MTFNNYSGEFKTQDKDSDIKLLIFIKISFEVHILTD